MPPHGHGGDEEEEEIKPRVDGPPFVDIHAKQGEAFAVDFDTVQKHLGPGMLSLSDFMREMDIINKAYTPFIKRTHTFTKIGTIGMMTGFIILILLGIIGGTPGFRAAVFPICFLVFLAGMLCFIYSKFIEQDAIRKGAQAVKKAVDDIVNPRYADSPNKVTWVVTVHIAHKKAYHMGKEMVERPVISIYVLKAPNEEGNLVDWQLPEQLMHGLIIKDFPAEQTH